jgi:hypothetical protein
MKKDDLILLIIGLLLLAGMLITVFFGGDRSRHGVGMILDVHPESASLTQESITDLKQLPIHPPVIIAEK